MNHHFIRSLQPFQKGWLQQVAWLHMPAFPFGHVDGLQKILLPLDTLSGRNQLLFDFSSGAAAPACPQGTSLARALINANSTLDFTHLTHFTLLPNLAYFVNDGFPFTRRPDLADSVIVLPDAPSRSELEAFFQLMGRFGESTGYPALYMTVASSGQIGAFPDKDILVIGSMADQPLLEKWAKYMPINPLTGQRQQSWRNRIMAGLHVLIGDDVLLAGPIAGTTDSVSDATQMTAFESPLKAHHSVVMVFSRQPEGLRYLRQPLLDSNLIQKVQGDWVAIQGQHIQAAALGAHYEVGTLPWMTWWRWKLSTDPLLLTLVSLFALTVVTILLYADLRKRAQKRMQ